MDQNEAVTEKKYAALRRNLIAVVVAVSIAPLILINAILIYHYHVVYKDMVAASLRGLALNQAARVDAFLGETLRALKFMAASHGPEDMSAPGFLDTALKRLAGQYPGSFEDLGLVDASGEQIAYAGPHALTGARYAQAPWFAEAQSRPQTISDVFTGLRGTPHFIATIRLAGRDAKPFVLRATVDYASFTRMLESIRPGKTGQALIVNSRGAPQDGQALEPGAVNQALSGLAGAGPVFFERQSPEGRDFVYAAAGLENAGWALILRQDAAEAMVHLYSARTQSLFIFAAGLLAIVVMALILSSRVSGRLALAEREQEAMRVKVMESAKLASIGELASGVAHEINNPVAIMIEQAGWIEDLIEDGACGQAPPDGEIRKGLAEIVIQGKRCRDITHKLLSFARKTEARREPVDLSRLVADIAALARQKAKYKDVAVVLGDLEGLPKLRLSVSEMQQILLNLINNAVDAVERRTGEVRVYASAQGDWVVISVADNGPGIPEAVKERIFDPFFTTKPAGQGTGLGLSICHGLVTKMGGEIAVECPPGGGTVFSIRLPVSAPPEQEETA